MIRLLVYSLRNAALQLYRLQIFLHVFEIPSSLGDRACLKHLNKAADVCLRAEFCSFYSTYSPVYFLKRNSPCTSASTKQLAVS
jgi:hypothetical protein